MARTVERPRRPPFLSTVRVVIVLWGALSLFLSPAAGVARAAPADSSLARLANVVVATADRTTVVELEVVGGGTKYRTSLLHGPPRIVIDVEGAVFAWPRRQVEEPYPPIREVRGSQWRRGIARVVVELNEPVPYRVESVRNGLRIVLLDAVSTAPSVGTWGADEPSDALDPIIPVQTDATPASRPPGSDPRSQPTPPPLWDVRGRLEGGARFWLNGRGEGLEDDGVPLEAEADIRYRIDGQDTVLRLRPRLAIDPLLSSRNRYEPLDAYVEYASARWALLAGQAVENWAVVETYNPVDVLNRRDLERDFYDPERLGELMLRLRYFMPEGGGIEQPAVALYLLPLHRETPLPSNRDRFRFDATGDNRGDLREDEAVVPSPDLAYAARLSATLGGADLFAVYFGGPTRIPSFGIAPTGDVTPVYYLVDMVGGGVQWAVGRWLLKLELAQTFTRANGLRRSARAAVPDDFFQYVVGIERTFSDLVGRSELTLALEYAGEDDPRETSLAGLRPYKSDVFVGAKLHLNDLRRTELKVSVAADVLVDEQLWLFELVTGLFGDLKVVLGGQLVNRAPNAATDRPTAFNVFPNNSNVWMKLRYEF